MRISRFLASYMLYAFAIMPAQASPLKVVATFSILGDITHEIAGDAIDLTTLVGPDADAHTYEPMPADIKALHRADLVIANGLGFEPWLQRLVESSDYHGAVVIASRDVTPLTAGPTKQLDPHAWQDVANAKCYVLTIVAALQQQDAEHAPSYAQNAERYLNQLDQLDAWTRAEINHIPALRRKLITTHDAFHYFGNAYGITLMTPLQISTEGGNSAQAIARLTDQMRAQHVKALFPENMTDSRLLTQLQHDNGGYIGGRLYSDALSPRDGPAATYVRMFKHNVVEIVSGIQKNQ